MLSSFAANTLSAVIKDGLWQSQFLEHDALNSDSVKKSAGIE